MEDVCALNQRIRLAASALIAKINACDLREQVDLMRTVPGVTQMMSLRIIAEMGANYHQRYYFAAAFAKGIGVVPSNEVSGGKLLKRRASHGNQRVKFPTGTYCRGEQPYQRLMGWPEIFQANHVVGVFVVTGIWATLPWALLCSPPHGFHPFLTQ
jgi:hypothetical protein